MTNSVALSKTDQGWKFLDENELENFIWENLETLLSLKPLSRQFAVKGEICDILAIGKKNQLVIIELKNTEDRYIINQVTRYYDSLKEEKPFNDQVDYNQEIRLLAICPNFHRHNLIDQKYSKLNLELFAFFISQEQNQFYFYLSNIDKLERYKVKLNYREATLQNYPNINIPEIPRLLLDWFGCLTDTEIKNLTNIRNLILGFDNRIEEIINNKSIIYGSKYGKDKMRCCAELGFDKKSKKILLFLWLIHPSRKNKTIMRMQIDTVNEYLDWWRYIPLKQGFISIEKLEKIGIDHTFFALEGNKIGTIDIIGGRSSKKILTLESDLILDYLENIVNEALQTWLKR